MHKGIAIIVSRASTVNKFWLFMRYFLPIPNIPTVTKTGPLSKQKKRKAPIRGVDDNR
jgi:hypothetical protein